MLKFATVIQAKGKSKKIHYVEIANDELKNQTVCGKVSGPFEQTTITYKDRYDEKVCKKCFKSYISSLSQEQ